MTIPHSLMADIDDLRGQFSRVDAEQVSEETLMVEVQLRGVTARAIVDLPNYPEKPPYLFLEAGWRHPCAGKDGRVTSLDCLNSWNRTYGLAVALRELNQRLLEHPPAR